MKKEKLNKVLPYFIILIVALLLSVPLMQKGIHTGDDGEFHISRTIGTIEQLKNHESPLIVSRFSNKLGFAWNLFYPPVTTIINVFFALLTGNVVTAMKIYAFITLLVSGIAMYEFVKNLTNNKLAAMFSAIIYMSAPYRMLNIYVRLAVGEMASFMFMPIIFNGLYNVLNGKTEKSYQLVIGAVLLALSHNISVLYTAIIALIYVIINIDKLRDKKIFKTLFSSLIIIILSVLFFELPLFEQMHATDYEVKRKMFTRWSVQSSGLNPVNLFTSMFWQKDGRDYTIGIPTILSLFLIPFALKRMKKDETLRTNYKFFMITGFVSCLMATFIFPWYFMPKILLNIQFPWRMLEFIDLCFSIVAGINYILLLEYFENKYKESQSARKMLTAITTILVTATCLYGLSFAKNLEVRDIGNAYFEEDEVIDTSWDTSRYSSYLEYWPQKAINNEEYVVNRDQKIHILQGNAKIMNESKNNGKLDFEISSAENDTELELPFLYYKGYVAELTTSDGAKKTFETTESKNGLVQIKVDQNSVGKFHVQYHATKLYKICLVISLVTMVSYLLELILKKHKKTL